MTEVSFSPSHRASVKCPASYQKLEKARRRDYSNGLTGLLTTALPLTRLGERPDGGPGGGEWRSDQ